MPQPQRYLPTFSGAAVLWLLLTGATFSLADPAATAQTKPATDSESLFEETVVVASRVPTSLSNQGVSVSVIDRKELELRSYSDVADFLDLLPGVSTTRDGGLGKAAALRIRGEEGFRTRIILDGIDIADPSSPQISPRIEHLMAEGLERIEVLRGPQGLMYGADAGGVVSLSSLQPQEGLTANLLAEFGERGHQRLGAHVAGGSEQIAGSLSVGSIESDGFNARPSDTNPSDADGYENTTAHATGKWTLNSAWSINASLHDIDGDNDYDGCFDSQTFAVINDCTDEYQQTAWRIASVLSTQGIDASLSYERSETERAFFSAGIEAFTADGEHEEVTLLGSWRPGQGQRLTGGLDVTNQALDDGFISRDRDNLGAFAEYAFAIGKANVMLGLRYDDNDDFGQHTSWRMTWRSPLPIASLPLTLKAAAGAGFRAPSLYEVAYNRGPFGFPPASDTELEEEQSRGWEAGIAWEPDNARLGITWFDQRIDNEIFFDLASFSGYLQSENKTKSKGLEFDGEVILSAAWRLSANVTWNETETASRDSRAYRPEWTGAANLFWQGRILSAVVSGRFARDAIDTFGQPMPDTERLDASLMAKLTDQLSMTARLENATDDRAPQLRDYNAMPRSFFLSLRYTL